MNEHKEPDLLQNDFFFDGVFHIPLHMLKVFIAVLIMAFAPQSYAEKMSNGQMAGIIRSANHPCAKVLELQSTGENSWSVQCNSGSFNVTRNADGQFSVNVSNK